MPFCNQCGADTTGLKFCSKCGAPTETAAAAGEGASAAPPNPPPGGGPSAAAGSGQVDAKLFGALAYVTIIPAILFLVIEPYKNDRFVRFHSFQCLFLAAAMVAIHIAFIAVGFVPVIGWLISLGSVFVSLGFLALWVFVIIKAYQGEQYRLPVIGDLAAKQV